MDILQLKLVYMKFQFNTLKIFREKQQIRNSRVKILLPMDINISQNLTVEFCNDHKPSSIDTSYMNR